MNDQQHKPAFVGIDIGGTKTAIVLSADMPQVLWREEFATLPALGPEHAVAQIVDLVDRGLRETGTIPSAIGVSCGGPLDRVQGVIQRPPNLPTWNDVPLKKILEERFSVPCYIENDANAGAVAEHRYGAGRDTQHLVFLTLGTGLGAGLILNGRILHGASAMAGEIGHVRLTEVGPEGFGKSGSVEGWASGGGIAQHAAETVRAAVAAGQKTVLQERLPALTARDVGEAFQAGDHVAAEIIQVAGRRLGDALAILVDLLNPERIVIGGLALRLGEALLGPARERLREEALPMAVAACTVVPAMLGESIGDIASLCVAMGLHNF